MPDRTPYNSLYEPFKGKEEASPSIKKTPVRKICCVHGAPCQIARNSNKVDREKNFGGSSVGSVTGENVSGLSS